MNTGLINFLALILVLSPWQQKPAPDQGATIRIGTEEVLLDVVARDKRGRPLADLRPEEVEVYEDGARQQVTAFRRVAKAAPPPAGGGAAEMGGKETPDPLRQINLVTLVFERLSQESRPLARDAALEFLGAELGDNVFAAVFVLDQRMHVVEPFTNSREGLRRAVERASGAAASQFADQSESIRRELEGAARATAEADAAAAPGNAGANPGAAAAQAKLAEMAVNMLRLTDDAQRQQQGNASVHALLSLVREQRRLAGRKTVLFFSEGLQVPPPLVDLFRVTVGAANRAQVSFYAVDARGLLTARQNEAGRAQLAAAARANEQQMRSRGAQPVTPEQAKSFDTAEDSITRNTQEKLRDLSESTGGFLVSDTNDLRAPMRRVAAELASYYELAYTPPARELDGKFRAVTVKTSRPDVVLQTRSGYYALPPGEGPGPAALPFEAPLLAALGAAPLPRDFDYRAAALRFARAGEEVQHALLVEVPLANLAFEVDQEKKLYRTRFALLALCKNAEGRIVQRFSQDYPLEGPLARLEALKRGNVVFLRHFTLAPGRYTLETAVRDRETNKTSARRAVLIVPAARPGPALSSVTVIKRVDPVDPGVQDPDNPLRFAEGKIIPNLGDEITAAPGARLSLYFVVYPAAGAPDPPRLAIEFLQDGQPVARAEPELAPPDARGRIPYTTTMPLEQFKAGRYEVRAVVRQGAHAAEEHAFFTLK